MSVLHDAEDVFARTTWHGTTLTHANIDDEATVVALLEELSSADFLLKSRAWHWSNPNRAIDGLLTKQVDSFKDINVDLACHVGSIEPVVQLNLVELAQEVVLDPELFQLLRTACLWQD